MSISSKESIYSIESIGSKVSIRPRESISSRGSRSLRESVKSICSKAVLSLLTDGNNDSKVSEKRHAKQYFTK